MPSSRTYRRTAALALILTTPLFADLSAIRGLIRSGHFADAVAECDRELKADPRSFSLYTMKGLAFEASGNRAASLSAFRRALAINPAYEPALKAAAQIEFENRDSAAGKTLQSILRQDPSSQTAHAMLAVLLFESRDCGEALLHFEKARAAVQAPAMKWQYGVCLLERQRWSDAAKQFAALLQLREHAPTRYNLALAYWNAKDYPSAVSTLKPMDNPRADADAMRLLASSLEAVGDTPGAFSVLQRAIQQTPRDERLLIDLAAMCMDHKSFDLGIEVVQAGIQIAPASARLRTLLGVLLVRSGNVAGGQEAFRSAQEHAPESGLGSIGLASTLMQMGLAADAVPVLREQLAAIGPDPPTELTLVRALLMKGPSAEEAQEAALLLQRILKQEPGNAVAHGLLGKVYFQLGEFPKATTELTAAIRLDPSDRTATYQLMTIYQHTGRTREAAELAGKFRALLDRERVEEDASARFRLVREAPGTQPER